MKNDKKVILEANVNDPWNDINWISCMLQGSQVSNICIERQKSSMEFKYHRATDSSRVVVAGTERGGLEKGLNLPHTAPHFRYIIFKACEITLSYCKPDWLEMGLTMLAYNMRRVINILDIRS
jgi:hypothetical protein